jgi:uncharacterized protein (DUF433 family)
MRKIVGDPRILGGKPVLEGTRMSVEQVLGLLAKGMSTREVVEAYPILTEDDVRGVVAYAQAALRNDLVLDVPGA